MRGEKLSDAIVYDKLNLLKKDFIGYIERNTEKVDANLPVFYGHVISALENSFPDILDESYDEFIDHITFEVLNASRNSNDFTYINKVIQNALRFKKGKDAETGINIMNALIGHTSGLAVPRYIIDSPGGGGKIPVQPNYIQSIVGDKVILENYEGKTYVYPQIPSKEAAQINDPALIRGTRWSSR